MVFFSFVTFLIFFRINLDSKEFSDHLQPFLHQRTDHFMHELILFARSPLDLIAYDNSVSYGFANGMNDQHHQSNTQPATATSGVLSCKSFKYA